MASNLIGEAILIIASVIVAGSVAGIVMSKVGVFESTVTSTSEAQKDKMLTKIEIIYASNSTDTDLNVWVKNIGKNPVSGLNKADLYFGPIDAASRFPYVLGGGADSWEYHPSLPTLWQEMDTVQLNVTDDDLTKNTTYFLRFTTPNGVSDDYIFTLP